MAQHNNINKPLQYQSGGIWPFIGGFWVLLINQVNPFKAVSELERLANINSINNWAFNEWFHGFSGKPMGVNKQSWNAATYMLAWQNIFENKFKLY